MPANFLIGNILDTVVLGIGGKRQVLRIGGREQAAWEDGSALEEEDEQWERP